MVPITHSNSFHFLFHSFIPTLNPVVSIFVSILSFQGTEVEKPRRGRSFSRSSQSFLTDGPILSSLQPHLSYSLNSLKGVIEGSPRGTIIGVSKGDDGSLDHGSSALVHTSVTSTRKSPMRACLAMKVSAAESELVLYCRGLPCVSLRGSKRVSFKLGVPFLRSYFGVHIGGPLFVENSCVASLAFCNCCTFS